MDEERLLEAMDDGEPYTVSELAEMLDEPRQTVDDNLNRLAEEGRLRKKKHTPRHVTFWIPE